jgi:hypothetical protein
MVIVSRCVLMIAGMRCVVIFDGRDGGDGGALSSSTAAMVASAAMVMVMAMVAMGDGGAWRTVIL